VDPAAGTNYAAAAFGIGPVVHEMRNFLAPMGFALELMRRRAAGDQALLGALAILQRQADGLERLVSDLLDVTRLSTGKLQLSLRRCSLADIAQSAIDICNPAAEARSQRLLLEGSVQPIELEADPLRLCQAIVNLVFNAVRHSPDKGTILVSLATEHSHAVIRVQDDGPGIATALRIRAFELGAQAEHGGSGGLGIGLYLVRCIAQLHGGTADAWSAGVGLGSTFTIRVPLSRTAAAAVAGH
jgi:signal transduction histidine kinase